MQPRRRTEDILAPDQNTRRLLPSLVDDELEVTSRFARFLLSFRLVPVSNAVFIAFSCLRVFCFSPDTLIFMQRFPPGRGPQS